MHSHFSSHTLSEIFRDLYQAERSGVLTLSREGVDRRVYFDRGLILYADSDDASHELGPRLIRGGKVSAGALEEATDNLDHPWELAQTLIVRDLITRQAMRHAIQGLIDDVVRSGFEWESGIARFGEGPPFPRELDADILSTCQVILGGIAAMKDFSPIHEAMVALDRGLVMRKPAPLPIERLALSPTHGYILSRIDGSTSLGELLAILPQGEEERAARFVFGLLMVGVVDYEPAVTDGPFRVAGILRDHADRQALEKIQERTIQQAYSQTADQEPHEVLAIDRDAPRDVVEGAYKAAKAIFGRDRVLPRLREKFQSELAVIESRLLEAFLRMSQPVKEPAKVEEPEDSPGETAADAMRLHVGPSKNKKKHDKASREAEGYYLKAKKALLEGDFHTAIQFVKLAISYSGQDARFFFMLADCQVRNPESRWQRLAEQSYTTAIELDPRNVDYQLTLGRFYKKRGLTFRAKQQFQEVLKTFPQHELALEELADLE